MLVDIETFLLNSCGNAETEDLVETLEDYEAHECGPAANDEYTENLSAEEAPAMTIEETLRGGEQASKECAERATYTVDRACADGVVNMKLAVDELNSVDHYGATDKTDDDSSGGRYDIATSGDADEACEDTVEGEGERGFAILEPADND